MVGLNAVAPSGLLALCAVAAASSRRHALAHAASSGAETTRRLRRATPKRPSHPARRQRAQDADFFLMSGQSNMCGHTTSPQSLTGDGLYWEQIKLILEVMSDPSVNVSQSVFEGALFDVIRTANARVTSDDAVAATLTNGTMELHRAGLLDGLDAPLQLGSCSYVEPLGGLRERDRSGGTRPTAWDANCGDSFGHEFMFSRTLELTMGQQRPFEAVKNARGGTEIHQHWYPGHGTYWESLQASIRSRKGRGDWKGFVWHQGTQESWTDEDTSVSYLGNLTGLVTEVRKEMFDASHAGTWGCPESIPVVIVQIGSWPQRQRAQNVRDAQSEFCDGDPRAQIVHMSDMSPFYHFDAPSFLIGGHRIAQAYQRAAETSFECPSSNPSAQPSASPEPSGQPSGQPSAQPSSSAKPSTSLRPSNQPSVQSSSQPSPWPSPKPSSHPSNQHSGQPSGQPSIQPIPLPSNNPSPFIKAQDDVVSMTTEEGNVTVSVLQNDRPASGPAGFGIVLNSIESQASNGVCTIVQSLEGLMRYEPNEGFVGTDRCIYEICDLSLRCGTATVAIAVSLSRFQTPSAPESSVKWEGI